MTFLQPRIKIDAALILLSV